MNYSEAELTAASNKGMAEAKATLASLAGPLEQAYAMGWNAVWASKENHERFNALKPKEG